jgi:hypothetical protein
MGDCKDHDQLLREDVGQYEREPSQDVAADTKRSPAPAGPRLSTLRVGVDHLQRPVHLGRELEPKVGLLRLVPLGRAGELVARFRV